MHRFRSISTIIRFRIAAALLGLGYLLVPVTLVLLVYSMLNSDRELTLVAIALGGLACLLLIIQWVIARRTHCPLCMTPVLAAKHCSKHRKARRLLGLGYLLVPVTLVLLVYSMLNSNRELTLVAIALGGLACLLLIIQWVIARRTHCPLCMTPVLAAKHCSKHRKARRLLGSHRLRAAVAVLLRGRFTCPYCNERSEMKVRERQR